MTRTKRFLSAAAVVLATASCSRSVAPDSDATAPKAAYQEKLPDLTLPPQEAPEVDPMTPVGGPEGYAVPAGARYAGLDGNDVLYTMSVLPSQLEPFYVRQGLAVKRNRNGLSVTSESAAYLLQVRRGEIPGTSTLVFLSLRPPEDPGK